MATHEYPFPKDEFDVAGEGRAPQAVHRTPRPLWRSALPFLVVLLIAPALAFVGVNYLASQDSTGGDAGMGVAAGEEVPNLEDTELTAVPRIVISDEAVGEGPPRDVRVVVLNGTGVPKLAAGAAGLLQEDGFTTLVTGNASSRVPVGSTVYYHSEDFRRSAERVAEVLGVPSLVEYPSATPTIAVVLRVDYLG